MSSSSVQKVSFLPHASCRSEKPGGQQSRDNPHTEPWQKDGRILEDADFTTSKEIEDPS
jgi:hypothetical protein